jgi:hypothetical protein
MPRPFPFPINIGTDICSINRILQLLTRRKGNGESLMKRILIPQERDALSRERIEKPLRVYWETVEMRGGMKRAGGVWRGGEVGAISGDGGGGVRGVIVAAEHADPGEVMDMGTGVKGHVEGEEANGPLRLKEENLGDLYHTHLSVKKAATWLAGR